MDSNEYSIYGIIEPDTKKIVFIAYYGYYWEESENTHKIYDYLNDAISLMQGDDRRNEYWKDLNNMWKIYGDKMSIVVLDVCDNQQDAQYMADFYRDLFKPRYNILDNKCECGEDCCCGNGHIKF